MSKFVNNAKTALLLGALTALVLWIGHLLGGPQGVVIALILAAAMNFFSYFFSHKIALSMMHAQEVGPGHELYSIVEELVQRTSLPMPKVYVSPAAAPNAFATGRNPKNAAVCATAGLMQMLDREEIAGVMAHELAHVKHRDTLIQAVAATIGGAISMLGYMFMYGGGNRRDIHPIVALLIILVGPIAAALIQMAISRSREFNADTEGANICGDPMHLARALEKIHVAARRVPLAVNPSFNNLFIIEPLNPMRAMANLFSTHPPLEQRLENLIGAPTTGLFRR